MMRITFTLLSFLWISSSLVSAQAPTTPAPLSNKTQPNNSDKHVHAKDVHGPHGGEIVEVGKEHIHLEVCIDDTKKELVLYVLDHDIRKAVALELTFIGINAKSGNKPIQFKAMAAPQKEDPAGRASSFRINSESLIALLHDAKADPRIAFRYENKPYSLKVPHDHDHHHSSQVPAKGKDGIKR